MRHKKTPIIIYDHHGHHQPRFLLLGSADGALDALGSTDGALDMLGTFDTNGNAASTPPLGLKLDDRMLDELGSADRVGYAEGALLALGIDVSDGIEVGNGDALGSIPSVSLRGNVISYCFKKSIGMAACVDTFVPSKLCSLVQSPMLAVVGLAQL